MKKIKYFLLKLLLISSLIILNGCNDIGSNQTRYPDVPQSSATNTPTITPTEDIKTKVHTPTSTDSLDNIMKFDCLSTKESISPNDDLKGMLVLAGVPSEGYFGKVVDIQTKRDYSLPRLSEIIGVSPDRTKFAYMIRNSQEPFNQTLFIEDNQGKIRKLPISRDWWIGFKWVDDERINFNIWKKENREKFSPFHDQVILNISDKSFITLLTDYPNMTLTQKGTLGSMPHFTNYSVVYSPNVRYVIYIADIDRYVLWDRELGVEIAKIPGFRTGDAGDITPIWSWDGNTVYFPADMNKYENKDQLYDWYSAKVDGSVKKITNFDKVLPSSVISLSSLSPDGKTIAFWINTSQDYHRFQLAGLNLETGEVINYCIDGSVGYYDPSIPIWSPDGKFLAVKSRDFDSGMFETTIIDPKNHWKLSFEENYEPLGWMLPAE
jgi:hypothetical protein